MSKVRVLLVPAVEDAAATLVTVEPTHEAFCDLIRDMNTDTVFFADGTGMVKVSAHGQARSLAANPRATQTVERFLPGFAARDRVLGPAVFVGLNDESDPSDVPDVVVEFAATMYGVTDAV